MKQTAVEWLWSISQYRELDKMDFEQAKQIEKEQMLDCYLKADLYSRKQEFEKYYETYNKAE